MSVKNTFAGRPLPPNTPNPDLDPDYPKMKYHRVHGLRRVDSPEAEEALGEGWHDSPAGFPEPEPVDPTLAKPCGNCADLQKQLGRQEERFSTAWAEITESNKGLIEENGVLREQLAALQAQPDPVKNLIEDNTALRQQLAALQAQPDSTPSEEPSPKAKGKAK